MTDKTDLLTLLQKLGDGEIDDLSVAHDAIEEIVRLREKAEELYDDKERWYRMCELHANRLHDLESVAKAICKACEENPDSQGDCRGNDYRWQDYLPVAEAAITAHSVPSVPDEIKEAIGFLVSMAAIEDQECAKFYAYRIDQWLAAKEKS